MTETAALYWHRSAPRYTSYPTALQFYPLEEAAYCERLVRLDQTAKPLSLYLHIPFCQTMCLFCACSVILNRKSETQQRYFEHLLQEIALLPFTAKRRVTQLHMGGGTPTSLTLEQFTILMQVLQEKFSLEGELSIEVDP